jgi:Protein of unknown function (DUF3800)
MILVFFDEAKNDLDYPHYHLGAVCIDESRLVEIEDKINDIAKRAFSCATLSTETEFHAAEIFHRKKNFKSWENFEKRISVLGEFMDVLSLEGVGRIDIQINCDKLHPGQIAEDIAFMFLCERANSYVRGKKTLGMLIGDRESDLHASRFATTLSQYRASGTDFAFGQEIQNLVDSVHFTQSHLSRFLQLADVYTWLLQFKKRNRNSDNFRHLALFELLTRENVNLFPSKYKEWPK